MAIGLWSILFFDYSRRPTSSRLAQFSVGRSLICHFVPVFGGRTANSRTLMNELFTLEESRASASLATAPQNLLGPETPVCLSEGCSEGIVPLSFSNGILILHSLQAILTIPPSQVDGLRDVFLCHASVDKSAFVHPLVESLEKRGITFWLDEAEVAWGDSITNRINQGLGQSRYVVVFLTDNFMGRHWPEAELGSALNRENSDGQTIVLPLICSNPEDILPNYTLLADKLYLLWNRGPEFLADRLGDLLNFTPRGEQHQKLDASDGIADPVTGSTATMSGAPQLTGTQVNFQRASEHRTLSEFQDLKSRLFALVINWVEFEDVESEPELLRFPGGSFWLQPVRASREGSTHLFLPPGIIPIHQLLDGLNENYGSLEFYVNTKFDFGDLTRRSRDNVRRIVGLEQDWVQISLVDDQANLTLKNFEDFGTMTLAASNGFASSPVPPSFSVASSYLWNDPPTDDLEMAIRSAGILIF